ncbi:MAG TPA: hypothetical protein VMD59_08125 [Acidimicrobiales bacterium]|nr:hypothetical protein [Acidimicrobiales bacterium]
MAGRLVADAARLGDAPVLLTAGVNKGGQVVHLYDPDGVVLELVQPVTHAGGVEAAHNHG